MILFNDAFDLVIIFIYVYVCEPSCRCSLRPDGVKFLGINSIGGCELPNGSGY